MTTPLTDRLGLEQPLIQAPMAGTSTPELAAAVSNAGALGSIAVGAVAPEVARAQIRATRALTGRPFNVNVFCHAPTPFDEARNRAWIRALAPLFADFGVDPPETLHEIYTSFLVDDAMLAVLVDEKPAVVSFHFGLPDAGRIAALKAAGILLLARRPRRAKVARRSWPASTWSWRRGSRPAVTAASSTPPTIRVWALLPLSGCWSRTSPFR